MLFNVLAGCRSSSVVGSCCIILFYLPNLLYDYAYGTSFTYVLCNNERNNGYLPLHVSSDMNFFTPRIFISVFAHAILA